MSTSCLAVQAGVAAGVKGDARIEGNQREKPEIIRSGGIILTNDTLMTGAGSRMQALLVDESALTLGPNSSLTIDRFVYDPNKGSGEVVANMLRGSLRFVSGRSAALSKPQFKIKTPVGVMGIRGTSTIIVERDEGKSFFMGLVGPGPENNAGLAPAKIEFSNEYGAQTVDKAGVGFFVEVNQPPGALVPVPADISDLFVNKAPVVENQDAAGADGEGEQQGEGGEENADNQEGGEENADNQEGGEQNADNQEGGEQNADNQEGGETTAENQENADGEGNNAVRNDQGVENAEGGESPDGNVATNETNDAPPEGPAPVDGPAIGEGETGTNTPPAPAPEPQIALAPAPDADLGSFQNVDVEAAAGQGVEIALPGLADLDPQIGIDDREFTEAVAEETQAIEQIVSANQTNPVFNIGRGAFIEFDWKGSSLVDIDGFLFGSDNRATINPFLIIAKNSGNGSVHPTIKLDIDCVVASCSEVIVIDSFPNTGLYGVGMFLDPENNAPADLAANAGDLAIRFNQGGSLVRTTRGGSEVVNGITILEISPPTTGLGDAWIGAQIDPVTGAITTINQIIDTSSDNISISGFSELSQIANGIDSELQETLFAAQSLASVGLDVSVAAFIKFDWTAASSSLTDFDGFLFGQDSTILNPETGSQAPFFITAGNGFSGHPHINLDIDCTGPNCSEVITISKFPALNGTYGFGMVLPSETSASTSVISDNASDLLVTVNQGCTLQRTSNGGSTITGGTNLLSISPPTTGDGNAWLTGEIITTSDADGKVSSQINEINQIFDANAETIAFVDATDLQSIANQIDVTLQKAVNVQETIGAVQSIDLGLRTFIEVDWTGTAIQDLDLHLNFSDSSGTPQHVFFENPSLVSLGVKLEDDSASCSTLCQTEVLTVDNFNNALSGTLYQIAVVNFDHLNAGSVGPFLGDNSGNILLRINQGGSLQRAANGGFRIVNGTNILTNRPDSVFGNTWIAATVDPTNSVVVSRNISRDFANSGSVINIFDGGGG